MRIIDRRSQRQGPERSMEKFVIEGGVTLEGSVTPAGNKNAALPILAAALLTDEELSIRNVPRIRDVEAMIEILAWLGVQVSWSAPGELSLCARAARDRLQEEGLRALARSPDGGEGRHVPTIDPALAERIRASFLLAGPLLARSGAVLMPPPGGDVIGRRRLDPHLDAFATMGAEVRCGREILMRAPNGLAPSDVFLDEPSVMATENVLMAASLTPGTTIIRNAACEPHVQDLARLLVKMGADIQGIGSNLLTVSGCGELGGAQHTLAPDHIEIGSFMALAGMTGSELRIKAVQPQDLRAVRMVFERLGLHTRLEGEDVLVPGGQRLRVRSDAGDHMGKIQDGPWPAFPADLTSIALALATQAEGSVLVHEWMFENRLVFTDKLVTMGANIVLCDPHRAIVTGPRKLRGERVESPDIRAGMAMLLAALCAEGRSEIGNIGQIDRGYERIDERLRTLGARIERVAEEPVFA
ncbi:MAG TPA: UDP-N-acetylglucosamine 1-carboxyvinyltransferase [Solirubrobacteraceae bacterium]|nr:UDP-N-acetylglucosamine 1-carboxyvinyltransferase [Solirubrobacteraceae bacterium]